MTSSWFFVFFFKQKTAYEMRISDWSSDVCSSDLRGCTDTRRQGDISEKLDKLAQLIGMTQLLWRIVFPCAIVVLDQIEILGPTSLAQRLGASNQVSDVLVETTVFVVAHKPAKLDEIGRAHVCTPVTNANPVCRL